MTLMQTQDNGHIDSHFLHLLQFIFLLLIDARLSYLKSVTFVNSTIRRLLTPIKPSSSRLNLFTDLLI